MKAAGYEYVNVDDCWMDGRDAAGKLKWNVAKFPSGIPALAGYVHSLGLKFGIYEAANTVTCVGIYNGVVPAVAVGSLGHEEEDAKSFASWGVDFLKYDLCRGDRKSFETMSAALTASGRAIFYSINPEQPPDTQGWDSAISNMWRIAPDIAANFQSVLSIFDADLPFARFASRGHWNDPDMLEVGRGMSDAEDRAHFTLWAMLAAPLLAGNDIRSMSASTEAVLTNHEVIAVDQDPLGAQATIVYDDHAGRQILSKVLQGKDARAVALLNRSDAPATMRVSWSMLKVAAGTAQARDLWVHRDLGLLSDSYATTVPSHAVVLLRIFR